MRSKYKILMLSDLPLCFSGVGVQARFLIEGLIATGKYSFRCLGGAIKHAEYRTMMVNPDFIVKPVDGFGSQEQVRQILLTDRPDAILIFTDPRQFIWLWEMQDEISQVCPITYWHIWDNYPYPEFNNVWYESTDLINCISWPTYDMVKSRFPERTNYIPHAFPNSVYHKLPDEQIQQLRKGNFGDKSDWFIGLWVNRNAGRKMPSDVMSGFKTFLDNLEKEKGHRKAMLIMHTDPTDSEGPNLYAVADMLGITPNIWFSTQKLDFPDMNLMYNSVDYAINVSKAEGFGLCLSGETLISTKSNGYMELKDIKIGDKILSSDGKYHQVLAKTSRKESKLAKIKFTGRKEITCSYEHPFMVADCKNGIWETSWVEAADLKPNMYLVSPKPFIKNKILETINIKDYISVNCEENKEFLLSKMSFSPKKNGFSISDIQKLFTCTKHKAELIRATLLGKDFHGKYGLSKYKKLLKNNNNICKIILNNKMSNLRKNIKIDEDFYKFIGWYLAEGSSANGKGIEISLHKREKSIAEWIRQYIKNTFNLDGHVEIKGNKCRYLASSYIFSNFMENICGKGAKNKVLNETFVPSRKEHISPLLKALFMGDGHFSKNSVSYTSISEKLTQQINDLLMNNDIYGKTFKFQPKDFGNYPQYRINIGGKDMKKFVDLIQYGNYSSNYRLNSTFSDANNFYILIKSVIFEEKETELFDIQVDETQNFVANGVVVHNCTLSSLQVGKPIIALKTGGETRQIINPTTGFEHGVAIEPRVKSLVGSQLVPYIYDDMVHKDDIADAMMKLYNKTPEEIKEISTKAIEYVQQEYNFDNMITGWDITLEDMIQKFQNKQTPVKSWSLIDLSMPTQNVLNISKETIEHDTKQLLPATLKQVTEKMAPSVVSRQPKRIK